jgi:hypothetical protein
MHQSARVPPGHAGGPARRHERGDAGERTVSLVRLRAPVPVVRRRAGLIFMTR